MTSVSLLYIAVKSYSYIFVFVVALWVQAWILGRAVGDVPKEKMPHKVFAYALAIAMVLIAAAFSYAVNNAPGSSSGCYDHRGAHDC